MAPRLPRDGSFPATCDSLRELASAYQPTLLFARDERFFPLRAESWLTHTSAADWPETAGRHGDDLPVDGRRRGTALVRADAELNILRPQAGTPPFDSPISVRGRVGDRTDLASWRTGTDDVFLDFGGWTDDTRLRGDEDYLARTFSEMAAAIEPRNTWEPVDLDPDRGGHLPTTWFPQPVTPTVYAEAEWGGMFPTWAQDHGLADFAPEPGGGRLRSLDQFLVLTYYYLYGLRHPTGDESAPTRLEGQWEAVSLFFPAEVGEARRADGRPAELSFTETPTFVVVSQNAVGGEHRVSARRWHDTERVPILGGVPTTILTHVPRAFVSDSTSVVLFVGRGTHAFHFAPQDGHGWRDDPRPGSGLDLDLDEDLFWQHLLAALVWLILVAAAIALAILLGFLAAAAAAALAAIALAAAVVIVALIAIILLVLLILALFALFSDHGSDTQPHPQHEDATGDGPQAGGSSEAPAGDPHGDVSESGSGAGGGGTGGGGVAPPMPGTPNAGSPTGRNTVAFDLRVIDRLNHDGDPTPFPPEQRCEMPGWWDYTGGWGVRVPVRVGTGWASGMRRVDEQRRSWGLFAAAEVARRLDDD